MIYFWLGVSVAFNVAQFLVFILVCLGFSSGKKKKNNE